jgi:BUD22
VARAPAFNKTDRKPAEAVSEKLHPSWEAKRKQQAISISSAPTNKKIKFD